jgi:hypothetical protein
MDDTITVAEKAQAGDIFILTREEMGLLAPWLHETLAAQERADGAVNSDRCQLFTRLLRLSHRLYGTPAPSHDTCICHG